MSFKALIFDLDDTLVDTNSQLVPAAVRDACQAMISAGLNADLEHCIEVRNQIFKQNPRVNSFANLTEHFGVRNSEASVEEIISKGRSIFYEHPVPSTLTSFQGAPELLKDLSQRYQLFLVTSGHPETQKTKVTTLNFGSFFIQLHFVNSEVGETKRQAFKKILSKTGFSPSELLSIGNRIDKEIAEAKELGIKTCLVKHGEYLNLTANNDHEIPDYEIDHIKYICEVCSL